MVPTATPEACVNDPREITRGKGAKRRVLLLETDCRLRMLFRAHVRASKYGSGASTTPGIGRSWCAVRYQVS